MCCIYATGVRLPSTLVREARIAAGLSRRALALRAGVPTSTVSRIEDDDVDPTFTMLERVLAAAGKQLGISATAVDRDRMLAGLGDIYDESLPGTGVDWTRLRGFIDWVRLHPDKADTAIATPPPRTRPFVAALLAAVADQIAHEAAIAPPRWTRSVPPLREEWVPPGTPRMIAAARRRTSEPFRRRNIVLAHDDLWRAA